MLSPGFAGLVAAAAPLVPPSPPSVAAEHALRAQNAKRPPRGGLPDIRASERQIAPSLGAG
jgi:hypothetical protein